MNFSGDDYGCLSYLLFIWSRSVQPALYCSKSKANVRVAHSSFINDALASDTRVNKVVLRDSPIEASGLVEVMMFDLSVTG
jgi:hypothetical protein